MELTEKAKDVLKRGSIKIRVERSGMYQQMTFRVKQVEYSGITFTELAIDRIISMTELLKIAEDLMLPVEAQNGRAFPKGTDAKDFANISL